MKRDLNEIIKSQRKMTGKDTETIPVSLYNSYRKHLDFIESWKNNEPSVEIMYIDYKETLENPEQILEKIESFLGVPLDKEKMASCIDISLYRNKAT